MDNTNIEQSQITVYSQAIIDKGEEDEKDEKKDESKGAKKKGKRKKKEKNLGEPSVSTFDIPGVSKCFMSAYTQKAVYCVVGDDVTAESQWKYVKKEYIIDNLELYEDESDFFQLKEEITAFPEPEILIGFIPEESLTKDVFYVVHDINAKKIVLEVIEKKKNELEDSLKKAIFKPVGTWISLGSEMEIDQYNVGNLRSLYEIEIKSKFPVIDTKVRFKMRRVEDVKDGYVELLYDPRYPIEAIERKRIDCVVQACPDLISHEAQTDPTYPKNVWTQHEDEIQEKPVEKKLDAQAEKLLVEYQNRLTNFVVGSLDELSEKITVNKHLNMHTDDYAALVCTETKYKVHSEETEILRSYSDVNSCKNKFVNDVSWVRLLSGIMVVSYSGISPTCLEICPATEDEVLDAIFNCTPVLIWDYKDSLKPKLFLESPRQVVYVRCSPYYKNIVIGGCINGQIVVWDLGDKLDITDKVEILSSAQKTNRLNLQRLLNWMKSIYNPIVIKPMIITNLTDSHKDMVTSITYVPGNQLISSTGKSVYVNTEEECHSDQFFTSSLDGSILFWDFKQDETIVEAKPQKKKKRLSRKPSALLQNQSSFKGRFKPHYKLNFNEGEKIWPILCVLRRFVSYFTCEDKYSDEITVTNHFKFEHKYETHDNFPYIVTSNVGKTCEFTWEGLDYNPGRELYTENVTYKHQYYKVHDGPIVVANDHKICSDIFVTIGGTIFAVWSSHEEQALFWRKCTKTGCLYVGGGWSETQSSYLFITRSDGYVELWDLLFSAVKPSRLIPLAGNRIMNMFGFLTPRQIKKNVIVTSDYYGTLTVYKEPELLNVTIPGDDEKIKVLFARDYKRLQIVQELMKNFCKNHANNDRVNDQNINTEIVITPSEYTVSFKKEHRKSNVTEVDKMNRIFTDLRWKNLRERVMYENILKKKKIDLTKLEQQRRPLLKIAQERREKLKKQQALLENKSKIFDNAKRLLFEDVTFNKTRLFSLPRIIDQSIQKYLEDYDEIEDRVLSYIEHNDFRLTYNWSAVLEQSKKRQKVLKQKLRLTNLHNRHISRKKLREPGNTSQISFKTTTVPTSIISMAEASNEIKVPSTDSL